MGNLDVDYSPMGNFIESSGSNRCVAIVIYLFSIQVYLTNFTYRTYTVQLKGNSN